MYLYTYMYIRNVSFVTRRVCVCVLCAHTRLIQGGRVLESSRRTRARVIPGGTTGTGRRMSRAGEETAAVRHDGECIIIIIIN